jgi:hypothetical protein
MVAETGIKLPNLKRQNKSVTDFMDKAKPSEKNERNAPT